MTDRIRMGGIGTALPEGFLDRTGSLAVANVLTPSDVPRTVLERLHDRIGIDRRQVAVRRPDGSIPLYGVAADGSANDARRPGTAERMAVYAEVAPGLAIDAAEEAIAKSPSEAESITHLVTASCTGFAAPGVDLALIESLGLRPDVARTNIGFMGCHAAINALRVGAALARESPTHRVLVVCVEISSVHLHHDVRLDRVISNLLFADGAAAVVLDGDAEGPDAAPHVVGTSAIMLPDSADSMGWMVGDHGFEMTLAADVPDRLAASIGDWVDEVLATHGLTREAVGGWAIHPGGPRVIDAVANALDLPEAATDSSRAVLRSCGNMSSGTVLHILRRLAEDEVRRPWVGLAFGPGLAGEMIIVA